MLITPKLRQKQVEYAVIHTASPYLTFSRVGLRQEGTLGEVWENMGEGQSWDGVRQTLSRGKPREPRSFHVY